MHAAFLPAKRKSAMLASLSAKPTKSRLVARSTLDRTEATGDRVIRYHDTDILRIRVDGSFVIDTGGFNTRMTRARLNAFLPQDWSVSVSHARIHLNRRTTGTGFVFRRSISVLADGTVRSDATDTHLDNLTKKIDVYMRALKKRGLPKADDSHGDPWVFGTVSPTTMLDWLDSVYVFRHLYVLALQRSHVEHDSIGYHLAAIDRNGGKLDRRDLCRIRRYIRACLDLSV